MKISPRDYSIYNRMEDVAQHAVAEILEEDNSGCRCSMCREDMRSFLLNQLPPMYVPILPGEVRQPLVVDDLDPATVSKVVVESHRAVDLVRANPRHEHERAPMGNCTVKMVLGAVGEVLTREGLELGREALSRLMAETLNELPPCYTTSNKGDAYARTAELDFGSLAKIYSAIYGALKRLQMIPDHD